MQLIEWMNTYVLAAAVPAFLMGGGIYFMVRLRTLPLLFFRKRKRTPHRSDTKEGNSPWKALAMALAGTLGVGNLVGVASAIAMGGAGAVFWMWVSATLAMPLKYGEIVLAIRHRRVDKSGVHGGAMYYMSDCCARKHPGIGRLCAMCFAFLCLIDALSMGCIVQVNAIAGAWQGIGGIQPWMIGGGMAIGVILCGMGGVRRISACTERLVPIMTGGFVLLSVVAISGHLRDVPEVFREIFSQAFQGSSVLGGVGGYLLTRAVRYGTMRGLLSNEAGCGTSPMAHATTSWNVSPVRQGCMGIIEVFVDTHVLCTMTALVILLAWERVEDLGAEPMQMTLGAYEALLGPAARIFMCVAVLCFGAATVFCWVHYACESCEYLVSRGRKGSLTQRQCEGVRRLCILSCAGCCIRGAMMLPSQVWTVADFAIGSMTILNLVFLLSMQNEIVESSKALSTTLTAKKESAETGDTET